MLATLNVDPKSIYQKLINAIRNGDGGVFFVYGHGGTGKTHLWRTLTSAVRSEGEIILAVASSGTASLLIPGGRTAHSRFGIPLTINEDSTCNIRQGSQLVELLVKAKAIIWDEAPMVSRYCFEALDKSLRDVLRFSNPNSENLPFGGKVVIFGGDFRQILPVVTRKSKANIVNASLCSSYL